MKPSKSIASQISDKMSSPDARFYALIFFLVIVFFTGGGSRDDIQSLIFLRPLAVLLCAYALTVKPAEQWSGRMIPLYIVGALLALIVCQLIPLPPSIWTELPGRQIFAEIANIAVIDQPWRPLTLSPSKTLNSLFSLTVPIAAIVLYLNVDREYRRRAVSVVIVLCVISALWAILQVVGSSRGPFYLYRITNFGTGVGLFANRNHQAATLASTLIMLGWYAGSLRPNIKQATLKFYASAATIFVLVPLIFVTGSRAGLILMVPGLILALSLIYFGEFYSPESSKSRTSTRSKDSLFSGRRVMLLIGSVLIVGMALTPILLSRSLAFDRLFGGNDVEELRVQLLPTLFAMLKDYMPWGSGFGSFEHVYKIYEPFELLKPSYLNQAHNDWLQYPIEGGVPGILIAIVASAWFCKRSWTLLLNWRSPNPAKYRAVMSVAVMLFILAASIGDYPLRVPSIMAIFVIMVCVFDDSVNSVQRREISKR